MTSNLIKSFSHPVGKQKYPVYDSCRFVLVLLFQFQVCNHFKLTFIVSLTSWNLNRSTWKYQILTVDNDKTSAFMIFARFKFAYNVFRNLNGIVKMVVLMFLCWKMLKLMFYAENSDRGSLGSSATACSLSSSCTIL